MGQQELGRCGVVAAELGETLEHVRHCSGVVACLFQIENADAVGFLFILAREAALFLDGGGLGGCQSGKTSVPAAGGGQHNAGEHGGHEGYLHALLLLEAAGEVALRQVRQFVGQDRGKLGFAAGMQKQAAVDAHHTARRGKGVQLRAVNQHKGQAAVAQLAGFRQTTGQVFDKAFQLRIIQRRNCAPEHGQPGPAELVLLLT